MKSNRQRKSVPQPDLSKTEEMAFTIVELHSETVAIQFIEEFHFLNRHCESPIETLLLAAMYCHFRDCHFSPQFIGKSIVGDYSEKTGNPVFISQQVNVGKYRVDFLLMDYSVNEEPQKIIVECDGHDFHERTKEQAARDRARDRFMQNNGYKVLRFTGSEIYADAQSCAEEIIENLQPWRIPQ